MSRTYKFFTYTFLFSWILWLPTVIHSQFRQVPSLLLLLGMFAGFAPSLVALFLIAKETDLKVYLKEKLTFSFDKKYLLYYFIFPMHGFVTLKLLQILDKSFVVKDPIPFMLTPLIFLQILFLGGGLGEEFGWRGYAQDKLQNKYGIVYATLILGLLWSIWHLPLFYMTNTVQSHIPLWQFLVQNTLLAYFYTWLYNKTNGNMILMILLHGIMNTSAAVFPYWQSDMGRYLGLFLLVIIHMMINVGDKILNKIK